MFTFPTRVASSDPPRTADSDVSHTTLSLREIGLWALITLAFQLTCWVLTGKALLGNDSYQYVSATLNLLNGGGLATDAPFFDVERAHGTIPAPLTTFAPGLPLLVSSLLPRGVTPSTVVVAMTSLSCCASALSTALIGFTARFGASSNGARLGMSLFAFSWATALFSGCASTEACFTACVSAVGLGILAVDFCNQRRQQLLSWFGVGVACTAAYLFRYAGLLVICGVGTVLGLRFFRRRSITELVDAATCLILPTVAVGLVFARNLSLTGTWQGGNTRAIEPRPWSEVLMATASGWRDLLLGDGVRGGTTLQVLVLLVFAALTFSAVWRRLTFGTSSILVVTLVYSALMIHVARTSVISYGPRMLYPMLPLVLMAAVMTLRDFTRSRWALAAAVGAAVLHLTVMLLYVRATHDAPQKHELFAQKVEITRAASNRPMAWALNGDTAAPLFATDGQVASFVLQRPVVGLIEAEYSDTQWTYERVRSEMERFGSKYLLLHVRPVGGAAMVQGESQFLSQLWKNPEAPPSGFVLHTQSPELLVFERL